MPDDDTSTSENPSDIIALLNFKTIQIESRQRQAHPFVSVHIYMYISGSASFILLSSVGVGRKLIEILRDCTARGGVDRTPERAQ